MNKGAGKQLEITWVEVPTVHEDGMRNLQKSHQISFKDGLSELIDNSIDAKAKLIAITIRRDDQILLINDNGIGLNQDRQDHYFMDGQGTKSKDGVMLGQTIGLHGSGAKTFYWRWAERVEVRSKCSEDQFTRLGKKDFLNDKGLSYWGKSDRNERKSYCNIKMYLNDAYKNEDSNFSIPTDQSIIKYIKDKYSKLVNKNNLYISVNGVKVKAYKEPTFADDEYYIKMDNVSIVPGGKFVSIEGGRLTNEDDVFKNNGILQFYEGKYIQYTAKIPKAKHMPFYIIVDFHSVNNDIWAIDTNKTKISGLGAFWRIMEDVFSNHLTLSKSKEVTVFFDALGGTFIGIVGDEIDRKKAKKVDYPSNIILEPSTDDEVKPNPPKPKPPKPPQPKPNFKHPKRKSKSAIIFGVEDENMNKYGSEWTGDFDQDKGTLTININAKSDVLKVLNSDVAGTVMVDGKLVITNTQVITFAQMIVSNVIAQRYTDAINTFKDQWLLDMQDIYDDADGDLVASVFQYITRRYKA